MACDQASPPSLPTALETTRSVAARRDPHSFANPDEIRVRHLDLDLEVLFHRKALTGATVLTVARVTDEATSLILDTRDLTIRKVEASEDGSTYTPVGFTLGLREAILGTPLSIRLPGRATHVRVHYETSVGASGLQWLDPGQTSGRQQPFMYTQSQAIHARSWIPLQDTPGVRVTYTARIRTPRELRAVMSAVNHPEEPLDGEYHFEMNQPVPSYLIALAVGDLRFEPMSARTAVYAEPRVVRAAAAEFADTERMMTATERLYGPYRWDRYDLLVLPPSFPFGGMENPLLTFATPTILAGDKSLVSLVAHELAHSWSGNLVTNATWRDFWLNEGFTTYLERRILEQVYGATRAEMEAVLGLRALQEDLAKLEPRDQVLYVDLAGRDPDAAFTQVPYEKGALFLRHLEVVFGRERFDQFLRQYFDHFAFQSITTADFLAYLDEYLLKPDPALGARVPVREWINAPALPPDAPRSSSEAFLKVEQQAHGWLQGDRPGTDLETSAWSTHEWLHFLQSLPPELPRSRMEELDRTFTLTGAGNAEIAHQWLLMALRNRYDPAYRRLEEYLIGIGRRKLIQPLYEELVKSSDGKERAREIYGRARPGYHPIAVDTLDPIIGWAR
jgi:leukotriene A-4 hydrolase/aminopeptidase